MFARVYKPWSFNGDLVLELGEVDTWDTSCIFCKLIFCLIPVAGAGAGVSNFQLRSYFGYTNKDFGYNALITMNIFCLGITGASSAHIVSQAGPKDVVRQLRCDQIDYNIILDWLKYCRSHHTENCEVDEKKPVKYLRLIHCETRKIILAGSQPYVTLSYVWGKALDKQRHNDTLPDGLPMTIEDSIKVAMALGYQYIWIDRYCIDQSRPTEVQHQVGLMDLVYKNSDLTIIAAAGEDPFYGLPGVSNRARATQHVGQVTNRLLLSTIHEPAIAIYNSLWNTRGWTYQEGLLSQRRLVFTDQQIYFECHGMYCIEGLNLPLDGLHDESRQVFKQSYRCGKGIGIFPRGVGTDEWSIFDRIEEYTKRALANDADILNGFKGVMRAFRIRPMKVETIYGIPFFVSMLKTQDALPPGLTSSRHFDLFTLNQSFAMSLSWQPRCPTTRRVGFPSWSWSGWHGPIYWTEKGLSKPFAELEIRLRRTGSSKWYDLVSAIGNTILQDLDVSEGILIKAAIVTIDSICNVVVDGAAKCQARTQLNTGGYVEWSFNPTTKENLGPQDCIAIVIKQYLRFDRVLVLKRVGLAWERVGSGVLGDRFNTRLCHREGICELREMEIRSIRWQTFKSRYGIGVDVDWFELI